MQKNRDTETLHAQVAFTKQMDFIERLLETDPTEKQRQIIDAHLLELFSFQKQLEPELNATISTQLRQAEEDKKRLTLLDLEIQEKKKQYKQQYANQVRTLTNLAKTHTSKPQAQPVEPSVA